MRSCPFAEARELAENMRRQRAGLHFVAGDERCADGTIFRSPAIRWQPHAHRGPRRGQVPRPPIADRPAIAAAKRLRTAGRRALRHGERGLDVSYDQGYPVGRFEAAAKK